VAVEALRRVLLVGFMASGKTSVGKELAALLGWDFHDFDTAIEKQAGATVTEIFRRDGEEHFRDIEAEVASDLLQKERVVLASGGGWPAQPGSWEAVPDGTLSVWLRVSPGVAVRRASSEGLVRPFLAGAQPLDRAVELMKQRETTYGRAQVALDSEQDGPARLATTIMKIMRSESDRA